MNVIEIPEQEWTISCIEFGLSHRGWLATLAVIATTQADFAPTELQQRWHIIADQVRLENIAIGTMPASFIITAQSLEDHQFVQHPLDNVMRVFDLTVGEAHQGLRLDNVEAGRDVSTFIWFQIPAIPEALNGLAEFER